jgi:hypothetical protein
MAELLLLLDDFWGVTQYLFHQTAMTYHQLSKQDIYWCLRNHFIVTIPEDGKIEYRIMAQDQVGFGF